MLVEFGSTHPAGHLHRNHSSIFSVQVPTSIFCCMMCCLFPLCQISTLSISHFVNFPICQSPTLSTLTKWSGNWWSGKFTKCEDLALKYVYLRTPDWMVSSFLLQCGLLLSRMETELYGGTGCDETAVNLPLFQSLKSSLYCSRLQRFPTLPQTWEEIDYWPIHC